MHFLILSTQYLPTVGGVERYSHSLAHTLAGLGHRATVVTSALPGLPQTEEEEDGVRVVRLPAWLFLKGRFPIPRKNAAFRRLAVLLWETEYDFALINSRFYPLSLWAAGQCRRRGIPALVLDHSTRHLSLGSALPDAAGHLYEHAAMAVMRRRCPNFYGVSRACCEWLAHFGVQAKGVLYNAVNPEELRTLAATGTPMCERLGLLPEAPLIAFSGRFVREKGVWQLVEAFADIKRHHPDAVLVMAGTGPALEHIRALKAEGVYCPGPLEYADNLAFMAGCDVFCLPTYYPEGFPTTVLEAAALGCCIVTTPAGGSAELVLDGETGLLLADHQPATVAAALETALADACLRRRLGQAACRMVEQRFTWDHTAAALLAIAEKAEKEARI